MSEGDTGIAVLLGTTVVVSVLVHYLDRKIVRAILVSSTIATIAFQILAYVHAGQVDAFILIAVLVSGAIAAAVSTCIGLVFLAYGSNKGS